MMAEGRNTKQREVTGQEDREQSLPCCSMATWRILPLSSATISL
jgi:hypothetical protein